MLTVARVLVPLAWSGAGWVLINAAEALVDETGDTVEKSGSAALKIAGAAAVITGAYIAAKEWR